MEAIEGLRYSGSEAGVISTKTAAASIPSVLELTDQTIQEQGKPIVYRAGDPIAIAAQLQAAYAGSAFIPFERVDSHNRLVLSQMADSDGSTVTGLEDLYLVFRGQLGTKPYIELVDAGRLTWTYGGVPFTVGSTVTGLYYPTAVAVESPELAKGLTGGLTDIQTYPKAAYVRSGAGRPALAMLFDKGPAIGVLRDMWRTAAGSFDAVVGRHLRWR